jgi:hypothetical protein
MRAKEQLSVSDRIKGGAFFGIFLVGGLAIAYTACVRPALRIAAAKHWSTTTCRIESSGLSSSRTSYANGRAQTTRAGGSRTYMVSVRYSYVLGGRTYLGDRYNFNIVHTQGSASKLAILDSLARGARVPCYYDPAKPSDSVIDRTPFAEMWWGLFGLPFIGLGLLGISAAVRAGG